MFALSLPGVLLVLVATSPDSLPIWRVSASKDVRFRAIEFRT